MSGIGSVSLLLAGLAALLGGVELILNSSAGIAKRLHLSPFLYGATIVALVTNAPELGINTFYALQGNGDAVIGNVIGSNVFNVLAVLGFAAALGLLEVEAVVLYRTLPLLLLVGAAGFPLGWDGSIGRDDGIILLFSAAAYLLFLGASKEGEQAEGWVKTNAEAILGSVQVPRSWKLPTGQLVVGLALVALGSWLVVLWGGRMEQSTGALTQALAQRPTLFGLSLLAFWTSLPELALVVMSALRGDRELLGGAILGSCVLNLSLVLGAGAVLSDGLRIDTAVLGGALPLAIITCVSAFGIGSLKQPLSRVAGAWLVFAYLAFLAWLILDTVGHPTARIVFYGVMGTAVAVGLAPVLLPKRYVKKRRP